MRSQRVVGSILFLLLIGLVPTASRALTVKVGTDANGFDVATTVTLTGSPTVNLDCPASEGCPASATLGSARSYTSADGGTFTIARCGGTGCSGGRGRVFVSDGAVDTLVLTDTLITNTSATTKTLVITVDSGTYTVAGVASDYPYAVELNGSYVAPAGQSPITPAGNSIRVSSRACSAESDFEGGTFTQCGGLIDNPALDTGETIASTFSIVAPPYRPAGTSQFSPKEQENKFCPFGESSASSCVPVLRMKVEIALRPGHSARLPGSIGIHFVNTPVNEGGAEKMADLFAALGPKGGEVYEFRLEASPGTNLSIAFRDTAILNSSELWVTRRGGDGDDDDGRSGSGNVSRTKARIENNGTGEVRAKGLCPFDGCPASNLLPVKVFCGLALQPVFETQLSLNHKGDGNVDLIPGLPCPDPAVLIMHPLTNDWVAAPMVF